MLEMEDGTRVRIGRVETCSESEAGGRLLGNARRDGGGRREVSMPSHNLLSTSPSGDAVTVDTRPSHERATGPTLRSQSPAVSKDSRRRATTDALATPTPEEKRRYLHSPPPHEDNKDSQETSLHVPNSHRRKRSASLGTALKGSNFLSVPHFLSGYPRPDTPPPVPWYRTHSAECLTNLPESPTFHPATLTYPVSAGSLSPVQIRSPSVARKAARHGMGLNTTDIEESERRSSFDSEKSPTGEINPFRRSLSASTASDCKTVMEALRVKREMDKLFAMEVTHHVRQWKKTGTS